jgi:hypothetical protein
VIDDGKMIAATLALLSISPPHQTKANEVLNLLAQMPAWFGFPSIDERNEIVRIAEKLNTYRTLELREGMRLYLDSGFAVADGGAPMTWSKCLVVTSYVAGIPRKKAYLGDLEDGGDFISFAEEPWPWVEVKPGILVLVGGWHSHEGPLYDPIEDFDWHIRTNGRWVARLAQSPATNSR